MKHTRIYYYFPYIPSSLQAKDSDLDCTFGSPPPTFLSKTTQQICHPGNNVASLNDLKSSHLLLGFFFFLTEGYRQIPPSDFYTASSIVIKVYYCLKKEEKGELHKAFKGRTNTGSDDQCNPAVSREESVVGGLLILCSDWCQIRPGTKTTDNAEPQPFIQDWDRRPHRRL